MRSHLIIHGGLRSVVSDVTEGKPLFDTFEPSQNIIMGPSNISISAYVHSFPLRITPLLRACPTIDAKYNVARWIRPALIQRRDVATGVLLSLDGLFNAARNFGVKSTSSRIFVPA